MIQGVLDRVPELFAIGRIISIQAFEVLFATPFWRKLQNKNGECCTAKMAKVARLYWCRFSTGRPGAAAQRPMGPAARAKRGFFLK